MGQLANQYIMAEVKRDIRRLQRTLDSRPGIDNVEFQRVVDEALELAKIVTELETENGTPSMFEINVQQQASLALASRGL